MVAFHIVFPSGERKIFASQKYHFIIGRSHDSEIFVDQPDVSRRHAEVYRQGGRYLVRDTGSLNGTTVNGTRIDRPTVLTPADKIGVGGATIIFEPEDSSTFRLDTTEPEPTATLVVASSPTGASPMAGSLDLLQVFADTAARIVQDGPLEGVLDAILRLCQERVGAERAAILLHDDRGELVLRAFVGKENCAGPAFSRSIVRQAIEGKRALLVKDIADDARLRDSESVIGLRLRSAICTPLVHGERLLGALYADTSRPDRPFGEADLLFVASLAGMIAERIENAVLADAAREMHRQEVELTEAAQIQARLLPQQLPRIDGYDLAVFYRPRTGVGGDYFDLFRMGDYYGLAIGDVIGKGVGAALLMANLQATVRGRAAVEVSPDRLLGEVNADVAARIEDGMFITICVLTLQPESGRIVYANAGHTPPLLCRANGTLCRCDEGGIPLGIFSDRRYASTEEVLHPGDTLLLYSDGITESANAAGELFGEERLGLVLADSADRGAKGILDGILAAVDAFCGADPFADDATLIALKRT